jgi:Putative Flp pilus-assembly TadE/G-like
MGLRLWLWSQFCSCLLCLLVTIPLRVPPFKPTVGKRGRSSDFLRATLGLARGLDWSNSRNGEAVLKNQRRQSGQALVAATFGLVVMLGAAGLAVDLGYLRYQRRLQQSAADSAALAGAAEAAAGNATSAAIEDATLNGFKNGVNQVTVNVNPAFAFGTQTGVQVQVSAIQPTFFMRIFGVNTATVSTAAVALSTSGKNCVYALNGFGTALDNGGTTTVSNCGVVDNSNLHNTGSLTANSVSVHGTASGSATSPAAVTGTVEAGDPLYRLTPPAGGGACIAATYPGPTGAAPPWNRTLNQGRYCSIVVTGNVNLTLNPGTYTITQAGGVSLNGKGTVTGTGVTIYLRGNAGPVAINTAPTANEILQLRAPTNGALAGILFYQNPGNTQTANIDGKGASRLQGALYFPGATLNLSNTGSLAAYTLAVAKNLSFAGTVNFGSNFSTLPGGSPIKNAVLVE